MIRWVFRTNPTLQHKRGGGESQGTVARLGGTHLNSKKQEYFHKAKVGGCNVDSKHFYWGL